MENYRLISGINQRVLPYIKTRSFIFDCVHIALCVLIGRVAILGAAYPFALAFMVGVDGSKRNVLFPFAGAIIGALTVGPQAYPALFCALLYMAARLLYPLAVKRLTGADKLLCLGLSLALMLPLFYISSWPSFAIGVGSAFFCLLLAVCFQNALRAIYSLETKDKLFEEEQLALCLLFGSFALALFNVSFYTFSLGLVIAAWVSLFAASSKGLGAVAASVALSAMLLLGGKAEPLLLADFALCTLCAVILRGLGVWGAASGFLLCAFITDSFFNGQSIGLLNAGIASAALVFIPKNTQLYLCSLIDSCAKEERTARAMLARIQESASEELTRAAGAVNDIAELFPLDAQWVHDEKEENSLMQKAALNICGDCAYRGTCYKDEAEFINALRSMLNSYALGIRPTPQSPIRLDCTRAQSMAAAAQTARDIYSEKCMRAYHDASLQAFAGRQLSGVGSVMAKLSGDIKDADWPDTKTAAALHQRLNRAGLPVKSVLLRRKKNNMSLELRLAAFNFTEAYIEEAVSKCFERRMRLLSQAKTSRELILTLEPAQRLKAEHAALTRPKRGYPQSGDSTGYANLANGHMLYVLSDGMGSGTAAHTQSAAAVEMLIKLYGVGFESKSALECVNRVLLSKGSADMYATLDALHIDLKTGDAKFIKCGASPSFVLRDGQVHTVYAESLPAGALADAEPAIHAAQLKKDDHIIMLTDGALDMLADDTKHEILTNVGGANTCDDAAHALLQSAASRGAKDDMTVMVIRVL